MVTLRCTQKLLQRMRSRAEKAPPASTGKLGDWFANILFGRQQLIVCVSEKSLLPVVIPAKNAARFDQALLSALPDVLRGIGVNERAIETEIAHMTDAVVATTNNRRVVGSMMDFCFMLGAHLEHGDTLLQASLRLAQAPCSPLGMERPSDVTLSLLSERH